MELSHDVGSPAIAHNVLRLGEAADFHREIPPEP